MIDANQFIWRQNWNKSDAGICVSLPIYCLTSTMILWSSVFPFLFVAHQSNFYSNSNESTHYLNSIRRPWSQSIFCCYAMPMTNRLNALTFSMCGILNQHGIRNFYAFITFLSSHSGLYHLYSSRIWLVSKCHIRDR